MSEETEICLPKLGESIVGATVVQWLKREGEMVAVDEPLVEVSTDKVNSEIPSPVAGRLTRILVSPDMQVEVGGVLALVVTGEASTSCSAAPQYHCEQASIPETASQGFLSPAVGRLVREHAIPLKELDRIRGSGQGGRITKRDIDSYVMAKGSTAISAPVEEEENIAMTPMRKAIAENMVTSFYKAPHGYVLTEVDITDLLAVIEAQRDAFLEQHGVKLTITAYLVRAVAQMVQGYPQVNATLKDETISMKKGINVGIAVALENGLVVPVIKGCESREIPCIAKALADLSSRARARSLKPEEVSGGSITLTNFGTSGALMGLPIIRHPEVVIMGAGAIQKKLVVRDDDSIAIRKVVYATLTFDHRAIDGMVAGLALSLFKKSLETQFAS